MASLELVMQNEGIIRGSAEVRSSLDGVVNAAGRAQGSIDNLGRISNVAGATMHDHFGATQGGISLAQGISQAAIGFQNAGASAGTFSSAAFAAANAASQLGRTVDDWKRLGSAMETTTVVGKEVVRDQLGIQIGLRDVVRTQRQAVSGWGVLWTSMKANPMTAVVGALGLVGVAVAAMGEKAEEAAGKWDGLVQSVEKAQASLSATRIVNEPISTALGSLADHQLQALTEFIEKGRPTTIGEAAGPLGLSQNELLDILVARGNQDAIALRSGSALRLGYNGPRYTQDVPISSTALDEIIRSRFAQFQQREGQARVREGEPGPNAPSLWPDYPASGIGPPSYLNRPPVRRSPGQLTPPVERVVPFGEAIGPSLPGTPEFSMARFTGLRWWDQQRAASRVPVIPGPLEPWQLDWIRSGGIGPPSPTPPEPEPLGPDMGPYLPGTSGFYRAQASAIGLQVQQEEQERLERKALAEQESMQRMQEIANLSQQINASLSDAVIDFAAGLGDAREIVAGLLLQVARGGLNRAFEGLSDSIAAGIRDSFGGTSERP